MQESKNFDCELHKLLKCKISFHCYFVWQEQILYLSILVKRLLCEVKIAKFVVRVTSDDIVLGLLETHIVLLC